MNISFDSENATFEWDENKNNTNFTKHGIHFKTAAKVFRDPSLLIREDLEHPTELRYNILGKVGTVLFVVCVFKTPHTIRLISARKATVKEQWRYYYGEDEL